MNTVPKWAWVVLVLIVLIGGWAILKNHKPVATLDGPVKIGFIGPLTGDAAAYGEAYRNTVALAVEEINTSGGIDGHQIEMVYEDGKCDGGASASAAQKLVNVDKVQLILGGFCSGETIPSVPVVEQGKVLLASPGASSPDLTGISKYFFRDYPSDATQGKVLADAAHAHSWTNTVVLHEQTDYASGVFKVYKSTAEASGDTVADEAFPSTQTDFRSILAKVKAENPQVIFVDTQTPAVADRIFKQLNELGWKPQLIVNDVIAGDPDTLSANAALLEGAYSAEFLPDETDKKFQDFIAAYKAKYGAEPPYQSYTATSYDLVYLMKDGIAKVGYDGTKLADWVRTVKNWSGASGSVTIGDNGDRVGGHSLEVIHGGKKERVQ